MAFSRPETAHSWTRAEFLDAFKPQENNKQHVITISALRRLSSPSPPSPRTHGTAVASSPAATATCGRINREATSRNRGKEKQKDCEKQQQAAAWGSRWGNGAEVAQFAASTASDLAGGGVPSAEADGSVVPSDPSLIHPWYCSGSFAWLALCFPNYCC